MLSDTTKHPLRCKNLVKDTKTELCFENPTQFFMFLPYISKFPDFSLICSFKIPRLFPDFKLYSKIPLRITQFPDNVLTLKNVFPLTFSLTMDTLSLAHLSRRLIGELIVYQWSGVLPSFVLRPSSVQNA